MIRLGIKCGRRSTLEKDKGWNWDRAIGIKNSNNKDNNDR